MNSEQKQKMADAISTRMRSIAEECDENLQFEYDVLKLALTALTAQPVDWQQRAEEAEAIAADVEEILSLLAEREWAEHCTKTDTGKRLEEKITELHDEAAPAVSLAELVPDEKPKHETGNPISAFTHWHDGWNSCRAAILRNIEEAK